MIRLIPLLAVAALAAPLGRPDPPRVLEVRVLEEQAGRVRLAAHPEYGSEVGDKVAIYLVVAAPDDLALVGTGKVTEVAADHLMVQMEQTTGKVRAGYLAKIQTSNLQRRPQAGARRDDVGRTRGDGFVAFGPETTRVVLHQNLSAGGPSFARVMDLATGQPLAPPLRHADTVWTATFSPDGQRIVTASSDGTARVWSATTGQELTPPLRHEGTVGHAEFSPDGRRVVTASRDQTARIWDASTGKELTPALRHEGPVFRAVFSPDGQRVVTASRDKTARVWDASTGTESASLRHEGTVWQARFSSDGQRILTASSDQTARVWDAATGRAILPPLRHEGMVWGATFSPDGRRVATASDDGTARIWDAITGQALTPPLGGRQAALWSVAFSPDGRQLLTVCRDKQVAVWDATTGQLLRTLDGECGLDATFSADGKQIVTADGKTAVLWDAVAYRPIARVTIAAAEASRETAEAKPAQGPPIDKRAGYASLTVAAQKTAPIARAAGGTIALEDGTRLEIPAGALPRDQTVSVRRLVNPGPGDRATIVEVDAGTVTLSTEATLTLPAPARDARHPATHYEYFAWHVHGDKYTQVPASYDPEKNVVRLRTTQFSDIGVMPRLQKQWRQEFIADLVKRHPKVVLDVPYYPQGSSMWCWAACSQMLMKDRGIDVEIWELADRAGTGYLQGLTLLSGNWLGVLPVFFRERRMQVEHSRLPFYSPENLAEYVVGQLSLGRPVLLDCRAITHAVVAVGYDENEILLHDPSGLVGEQAKKRNLPSAAALARRTAQQAYVNLPWEDFFEIVAFQEPFTKAFPGGVYTLSVLEPARKPAPLTVTLFTGELKFWHPHGAADQRGDKSVVDFVWDGKQPGGWYFKSGEWFSETSLDTIRPYPTTADSVDLQVRLSHAGHDNKLETVVTAEFVRIDGGALIPSGPINGPVVLSSGPIAATIEPRYRTELAVQVFKQQPLNALKAGRYILRVRVAPKGKPETDSLEVATGVGTGADGQWPLLKHGFVVGPGQPRQVRFETIGKEKYLKWDAVPDADQYEVFKIPPGSGFKGAVSVGETKNTQLALDPAAGHQYFVVARHSSLRLESVPSEFADEKKGEQYCIWYLSRKGAGLPQDADLFVALDKPGNANRVKVSASFATVKEATAAMMKLIDAGSVRRMLGNGGRLGSSYLGKYKGEVVSIGWSGMVDPEQIAKAYEAQGGDERGGVYLGPNSWGPPPKPAPAKSPPAGSRPNGDKPEAGKKNGADG